MLLLKGGGKSPGVIRSYSEVPARRQPKNLIAAVKPSYGSVFLQRLPYLSHDWALTIFNRIQTGMPWESTEWNPGLGIFMPPTLGRHRTEPFGPKVVTAHDSNVRIPDELNTPSVWSSNIILRN